MRSRYLPGVIVVLGLCGAVRPAAARDCHEVKAGATLYADVMAETVVGATTATVVGWFGRSEAGDPTVSVKLVKIVDGEGTSEVVVRVKKADATSITCPAPWRRGPSALVMLTWPDARWAGQAVGDVVKARRKRAKVKHGRACFASDVPGVSATVCAAVDAHARTTCVVIPAGKVVHARASTSAPIGTTTERVVGEQLARVDDLLYVRVLGVDDAHEVYVRRKDATAARCPAPDDTAVMRLMPTDEALLPDGTDAGFRVDLPSFTRDVEKVVVAGRTLACFDYTPVVGLRLRVCVAD